MTNYKGINSMLTTAEVARLLGVHPSTIRRWSESGKLKAYRIGPRGAWRFRREDVAVLFPGKTLSGK